MSFIKRPRNKSSQSQIRARSDVDTVEEAIDDVASPSTLAKKVRDKAKKKTSRLSFGDDAAEGDSDGAFKLKKSNLSRKLALGTHPAIPASLSQASLSPSYSQEHINELKASTRSSRPSNLVDDVSYDVDMSMDSEDISMQDVDDSAMLIPTEVSIKAAKDKREQLRKTGGTTSDGFISLSITKREDVYQGPHPDSRLMREEDELGDAEEEFADFTSASDRIALGKKSKKVEASKRRETMEEMIADAEEQDDEGTEWENEQLRRSGLQASSSSSSSKPKLVYKAAPIPPATALPTLGPSLDRLAQQLTQLTTSHTSNTTALTTMASERDEIEQREQEMRVLVEKSEEKRAWFSSFREWLESVAGFLDEKYPALEKLEDEFLSLLQEKHAMVYSRRQAEDTDDLDIFIGSIPSDAGDEAANVISKIERREARTARLQHSMQNGEDGYSTDSAIPESDEVAYRSALNSLSGRLQDVLSDVKAEEFRDPGKGRWSSWRNQYADSYFGAYGGLGVVSVWEFWARLEIVGWDPIEDTRSLDSFKWYQGLYEYCRPDGEDAVGPEGDLVSSMISTAVIPRLAKVIQGGSMDAYSLRHIRRVIDLAEEVQASVDEEGANKLQVLEKAVATVFEKEVSDTQGLLAKYAGRTIHGFNPESIPARKRFLQRRRKLLTNLIRWRKFTQGRWGVDRLVTSLLEGCIMGIAVSGWEVGGMDIAIQVASTLPRELVPIELDQRLNMAS